jgi:hypothetical protein
MQRIMNKYKMAGYIFLLLVFFLSSCSQRGFVSLSKKIENECTSVKRKWAGTTFHELRAKLYNEGMLNFMNADMDTLYIMERYDIESATFSGRIWNRKGVLNYTYDRRSFSFDEQKLFTDYTVQLVQDWNTVVIRMEESTNAHSIPEHNINASRVFITKGKNRIDCILFKEFFKLERDR